MSSYDHVKNCSYCSKTQSHKPVVKIKGASSYNKQKKLSGLAAIIKGVSYPDISSPGTKIKGASSLENNFQRPGPIERAIKLKELSKLIRGP